jgi:hypothetical protein
MMEPDQNDPAFASSEKTKSDANSPPARIRPDSPTSQSPPDVQPAGALSPMPLLNSVRPPSVGLPHLTPKASSAPVPRLRPVAPPESANNIGPGAILSSALSAAEISATQEIAEALSTAQWSESRPASGKATQAAPSVAGAPMGRMHVRKSGVDPLRMRRTIIPILLTGGVILAGAGVLLLFGGEDNALSDLFPGWVPIMFCVLASVCLVLGVLNMLAVKNANAP